MKRPRVLLADDHQLVTDGLRRLLEPEFHVVGSVADGVALVETAQALRPDVVVTDISMPLLDGIAAARELRLVAPATKVIFLTMHLDRTYATRALETGAMGYVLKLSAVTELIHALREVLRGRVYVSPDMTNAVLQAFMQQASPAPEPPAPEVPLTPRQREVLGLLAEGHSAKDIATLLHISSRTVEFHKYRMMTLLGLRSSAALIHYAIQQGVASSDAASV